jgi:hypothetical protein
VRVIIISPGFARRRARRFLPTLISSIPIFSQIAISSGRCG